MRRPNGCYRPVGVQNLANHLTFDVICCTFISGCKGHSFCAKLLPLLLMLPAAAGAVAAAAAAWRI